jgi:hypothetical protein
MSASVSSMRLALLAGVMGLGFSCTAQAQNVDKLIKNSEVFVSLGSADMGYSDSGLALRLGVDTPGIVPLGQVNIGGTAYYTHTSSSYKYNGYGDCSWDYSSNVISAGPTLNFPVEKTGFTLQGRITASIGFLSSSAKCNGNSYGYSADSGTDLHIGLGLGAKYQIDKQFSVRADWDDWGYSTLTVGVGYKF